MFIFSIQSPFMRSLVGPTLGSAPGVCTFGLTAKYQLTTALARLRERGNPDESGWVRDSLIWREENNPSPPASSYPLPSERAVINCGPAVDPNVEARGPDPWVGRGRASPGPTWHIYTRATPTSTADVRLPALPFRVSTRSNSPR